MLYGYNFAAEYEADILGEEESLSMAEVAAELGLTRERVRQLIRDGYLRAFASYGVWCIGPQAVRDYRARRFRETASCVVRHRPGGH